MERIDKFKLYEELIKEIKSCKKCPLHKSRRNVVPGEGSINTEVMFIGEAPGEKEDEIGRPFVGPAGQLLTRLLTTFGLPRETVYITNIVKCRPPSNRDPQPEEINACLPYLIKQIEIIKPKLIICLGRHSAREILKLAGIKEREVSQISKVRGKIFKVKLFDIEVIVLPTYHPAAALYNPSIRTYLENDLKRAIEIVKSKFKIPELQKKSIIDFFNQ